MLMIHNTTAFHGSEEHIVRPDCKASGWHEFLQVYKLCQQRPQPHTITTRSKPQILYYRIISTNVARNMLVADLSIVDEVSYAKAALETSCAEVNTNYSSNIDTADLDEDDHIIHTLFDLGALGTKSTRSIVFTSEFLGRIASEMARIQSEHCKPDWKRKLGALYWTSDGGRLIKIWKDVHNANEISVNYMTRIEMSSRFQRRFGNDWARTMSFRALNASMPQEELDHLAAP